MKKMMFAVIASLFAAVTYAAGVASANIVGYAGSKLCNGAKVIAPQFASVGKNGKFNLQDFTGIGDKSSGGIYLNQVNSLGGITKAYMWVEDYGDNGNQKCWLDCDTYEIPENEVVFDPGQAFYIEAQNDSQRIQSSGEVPVNDAVIQLCNGVTLAGNFTPAKMALQDIVGSGKDASGGIYIDLINQFGGIVAAFMWVEDYGGNGDQKCWLDCDTYDLPVSEIFFDPGQAFWIEGQNDNQFVTFPGVEL